MTSYFVLWRHDVIFCSVTSWRHILSRDVHLVSLFGVSWVSWLETLLCSVTSYLVTWRHNLRCPVPSRKVWFPKTAWCVLSTKTEEKPPIYGWRCVSLEFLPEFPDENHNQWAQEAAYGSWFLSECPISAAKKKKKKKKQNSNWAGTTVITFVRDCATFPIALCGLHPRFLTKNTTANGQGVFLGVGFVSYLESWKKARCELSGDNCNNPVTTNTNLIKAFCPSPKNGLYMCIANKWKNRKAHFKSNMSARGPAGP